jgi:hypothetical protein
VCERERERDRQTDRQTDRQGERFKYGFRSVYISYTKKAALSKKKTPFSSKLALNLRKKLVNCYIWNTALYYAETSNFGK